MRIFFDSSAFAKRYVVEAGSDEIDSLIEQATELGLCVIAIPEIISAFCRLKREDKINTNNFDQVKKAFFIDIEDAIICQLTEGTLEVSYSLLEQHVLRTMDALHIAAAYIWRCDLFVSSDLRQLTAAKAFGLKVYKI